MAVQHPIELLAPAKDLDCGIAAIDHGADAVYIGPPKFSARQAAGNSIADIGKLVRHAHLFSARVYIALNTLLSDRELEEAVGLAWQLYDAGVDALIIQDLGFLECDLPPLPLHASTQTNNRTVDKVRFLEDVGFSQIVLARELSLARIREIREGTTVPLECFIHGALCVSYSGQCYISEVVSGRSANRGECAQFCRHKYTLRDGSGKMLDQDRYFLSLKDLDLSAHIRRLLDAGISSFKIEGRLKDIGYVKNVTAFYRKHLDGILGADKGLERSSSGSCTFLFTPDTSKSFNRGKTEYFLTRQRNRAGSIQTPKSLGEKIGAVSKSDRSSFILKTDKQLHNGDGLCCFNEAGELVGLKANRVEGQKVFHRSRFSPKVGTVIYRNYDAAFDRLLKQSEKCRTLPVQVEVMETTGGFRCRVEDGDGRMSSTDMACEKSEARQPGLLKGMIDKQMRKSGGTVFRVERVRVEVGEKVHVAASVINELRREALSAHRETRLQNYRRQESKIVPNDVVWLSSRVTYLDNIANTKAEEFYRRHGVAEIDLSMNPGEVELMRTKYCIRAQLGICKLELRQHDKLVEPFTLTDNTGMYELEFDCGRCEMIVRRQRG